MSSPRPTTTTMPGISPEPTASTAASSMPLQSCADAWAELSASARERTRRTAGRAAPPPRPVLFIRPGPGAILYGQPVAARNVGVEGGLDSLRAARAVRADGGGVAG